MTAADEAIDLAKSLIRPFEELRLAAYYCPAGFPTQGYGRVLSWTKWADLSQWPDIDEPTAEQWLTEDTDAHRSPMLQLIHVPLTPEQDAALTDWTFNLGPGRLECSTLRRVINRGHLHEAPRQFRRWVHSGGRVLRGLVRRREAEIEMWLAGS